MGDSAFFIRPQIFKRPLSAIVNEFTDILKASQCRIDFDDSAFHCEDELTKLLCPDFKNAYWEFRSRRNTLFIPDYAVIPVCRIIDKDEESNNVNVYISSADYYDHISGMPYYSEINIEAVYCSDLLLEMAVQYMKRYPEAKLHCESGYKPFYDSTEINKIASQPFRSDWYYIESSIN